MNTPFDAAIAAIAAAGFHNHRRETHSDVISDVMIKDLQRTCAPLRSDLDADIVGVWPNVRSPGDRRRKIDLFVGEPLEDGRPDLTRVRIAIEHKSVITAHRNATNRFDDLTKIVEAVQGARPQAIVVGTVLIGTALQVLNVPDRLHPYFRDREEEFETKVRPRLSSGDESLLTEFAHSISPNAPNDAPRSVAHFRELPTRGVAETHKVGYDSLLLVPVHVDNVHAPSVQRDNALGVDVDAEYQSFLDRTCAAYTARWHM